MNVGSDHFDLLASKLLRQANVLTDLMSNLSDPRGSMRRMYAHTVLAGPRSGTRRRAAAALGP